MRVFIDVTGSCKSAKNTGVQRVTRRIFATLAAHVSVTPICWNHIGNYYHRLDERELDRLVAPFDHFPSRMGRPEFRGEKFPSELRRLLVSSRVDLGIELRDDDVLLVPDIYSDHRTEFLPELLRRTQARSVAIFHDATNLSLGVYSGKTAQRFRKYVESLAAFGLVICISQQSRNDLIHLWQQTGVTVAPETPVEGWPTEFNEKERSLDRPSSRNVVLCVGSFDPRKNHLKLFEAATQLWDAGLEFELQLVGRSSGRCGYQIVPRIRWLQAKGHPIWWLKHISDHALHHAYRECEFTVYPSLCEGFGLPILESLWHGKPCLCGNNGALGEVANGGGCLFVDQTSASALAEGMKRLLTNRETYARLCTEARQRNFRTWTEYGERLLEYLQTPTEEPSHLDSMPALLSINADSPSLR